MKSRQSLHIIVRLQLDDKSTFEISVHWTKTDESSNKLSRSVNGILSANGYILTTLGRKRRVSWTIIPDK